MALFMLTTTSGQNRTERTGYEGDYFSLEGAVELFKQSRSIRDFERKINSRKTYVNNLDLNYDGRTDYIRVEHRRQGDFHAIILQVPIDRYELQDVAVIEIEIVSRRDAVLQIIGDADLYGESVIVEPIASTGYSSNRRSSNADFVSHQYVNVYYWPVVQHILGHRYRPYVSPYRWSYYPTWWNAWRPYSWRAYHPRIRIYYRHCHVVHIHRSPRVHRFYLPYRSHSRHVSHRTAKVRAKHANTRVHRPAGHRNGVGETYGGGQRKVKPRGQGSRSRTDGINPRINRPTKSPGTKNQHVSESKSKRRVPAQVQRPSRDRQVSRQKAGVRTQATSPRVRRSTASPHRGERASVNQQRTPGSTKSKRQITSRRPSSNQRVSRAPQTSRSNDRKAQYRSPSHRQKPTVRTPRSNSRSSPQPRINRTEVQKKSSPRARASSSSVHKSTRGSSTVKQRSTTRERKSTTGPRRR